MGMSKTSRKVGRVNRVSVKPSIFEKEGGGVMTHMELFKALSVAEFGHGPQQRPAKKAH